jgi:cytochrome c oxidase assembly protein subunit 15
MQIFLGGLTSANFAATSCQTLPDCHGTWLPGSGIWKAMDLSRHHEVTSMGQAIGGQERIDIHIAHRLGAVITTLIVLAVGFMAWSVGGRLRKAGATALILVTAELSIGITAISSDLPIELAVAHNWVAGLLLLVLLKIAALSQGK